MARNPAAALAAQLRSPLIRSGYALILSSAATSILGFVFWVVAARSFTSAEVGLAVAAISATDLIANLANLGWKSGLTRFVGEVGIDPRRLVGAAYLTASAAAAFGGVVFLIGQQWWTPELGALRVGWAPGALFIAACIGWVLFQLEDSVLIGTQRAGWVPVENAVFSALRIVLLVVFAAEVSSLGIYYAWAVAIFPLIFVVNVMLARRLRRSDDITEEAAVDFRSVLRFSVADWVASTALLAMETVIPLIILAIEGPTAAAYYYLAFTMTLTVRVVSSNVADALVAHASVDRVAIRDNAAKIARIAFAISVPMVASLIIAAPWLLAVFGSEYADEGTTLLRLMALSAIPNVILEIYSGVARSERRQASLVAVSLMTSILVVGLTPLLLAWLGLVGVGLAWTVGLSALAVYLLLTEFVDWWATHVDARLLRALGALTRRRERDARRAWVHPRLDGTPLAGTAWAVHDTIGEIAVTSAADPGGAGQMVVRFARSGPAAASLAHHWRQVAELLGDERLGDWRRLVPRPNSWRPDEHFGYLVESHPDGVTAAEAVADGADLDRVVQSIVAAIEPLHQLTADHRPVVESDIAAWIHDPIERIHAAGLKRQHAMLDPLHSLLRSAWLGQNVAVSRVMGDLALENVLLDAGGEVVAFIDWRRGGWGPSSVDLANLALTTGALRRHREMGAEMADLLAKPRPELAPPESLLLAWLWHVDAHMQQAASRRAAELWRIRNVETVLAAIESVEIVR